MKKFRNVHVQGSFNIANMQSHAKHIYLNSLLEKRSTRVGWSS